MNGHSRGAVPRLGSSARTAPGPGTHSMTLGGGSAGGDTARPWRPPRDRLPPRPGRCPHRGSPCCRSRRTPRSRETLPREGGAAAPRRPRADQGSSAGRNRSRRWRSRGRELPHRSGRRRVAHPRVASGPARPPHHWRRTAGRHRPSRSGRGRAVAAPATPGGRRRSPPRRQPPRRARRGRATRPRSPSPGFRSSPRKKR